ncbi:MAG: hypothetical protein OXC79_02500, partial [Candidatus Poribacteria bacterium]|nr:hypothetical protein [Candidatus Poribacteria bacterium]
MLSKKMAFSLMSLITIFALAFVASTAIAADGGPTVKISTADHHFDDGKQVVPSEPDSATPASVADDTLVVTVEFSDAVRYNSADAGADGTPANDFTPTDDVMFVYTNNDGVEQTPPDTTTIAWAQKSGKKYEGTITNPTGGDTEVGAITKVIVYVRADAATAITGSTQGKGNQASGSYMFSLIAADPASPEPVILKRLPPQSGFMADKVTGAFQVKIVLSENPKEFKAGNIGIQNGTLGAVVPGGSIARNDYITNNEDGVQQAYQADDNALLTGDSLVLVDDFSALMPMATGADGKFYRFSVTVTPDFKKEKVIVWVKDFEDRTLGAKKYSLDKEYIVEGKKIPDDIPAPKRKLEVTVDLTGVDKPTADPGMSVGIPNDTIIPAGGYLVVVRDDGDGANEAEKSSESLVTHPGDRKTTNLAGSGRSVVKQLYNVVPVDLKYDLEGFLIRGGTIDLIAPAAGVKITEIMWATDGGKNNRQWIEIHNMGSTQITTKDYKLMLYT